MVHKFFSFFFFGFSIVYFQNFQPESNHSSRLVDPSGVNHWLEIFFFTKCRYSNSNWEHTHSNLRQTLWDQMQYIIFLYYIFFSLIYLFFLKENFNLCLIIKLRHAPIFNVNEDWTQYILFKYKILYYLS